MIYVHTRDRYGRLVTACPRCGQTHIGLNEGSTYRWQRDHTKHHDKEKP